MKTYAQRIEDQLNDLYYEIYNRPRNFWTGLKFTPEEARAHYDATMKLERTYYEITGNPFVYDKAPEMTFKRKRYLEKNYPGGVHR